MKKYFSNFDWLLVGALFELIILGLFIISSVSPGILQPQLIYVILGLGLFFLFSQIDYTVLERFSFLLYLASIFFLLLPIIFGTITRGAVRWIQIGNLTLQPSEIAKPFLILFFASLFSRSHLTLKNFFIGGFFLIPPVLLIFWQPDLGSSLIVAISWFGIAIASDLTWRALLIGTIPLLVSLPLVWELLKTYQRQRIVSFPNPSSDPLGAGYNLIQATIAVGSGQLLGRGFGRGTQSHLRFLPERQTDFIFASFAEELGFAGSAILVLGFFLLLWRILAIGKKSKDSLGYLICLGTFSMLFFQAFVNIGMNLGLLPITGVTLPLVSVGGSSLVSTLLNLGIVESVARLSRDERIIEIR